MIVSVYQTGGDYFFCDLLPSVYISRWENGSRVPSLQTFKEICKVLHVSADVMLELTDESD